MSIFPVELKKFKKISSDAKTTTIQHPAGHKITIAHSALDAKTRNALHDLPSYADGGEVKPQEPVIVDKDKAKQIQDSFKGALGFADGGDVPDQSQQSDQTQQPQGVNININAQPQQPLPMAAPSQPMPAPQLPLPTPMQPPIPMATQQDSGPTTPTQAPTTITPQNNVPPSVNPMAGLPANDPYGFGQQYQNVQSGIQQQKAGILGEAQAQGQLGQQQAKIEQESQQQQQGVVNKYNQTIDDYTKEQQAFQQDIANNHVDPKHYFSDMSTGQKIGNAIGLIMGGIGGGILHQENPALKYMNQQIDRDVQAQKDNMNKTQNLMSANSSRFKNVEDATMMTKVMLTDIAASKAREAAATAQDPIAKYRAMQLNGDLLKQNAGLIQQGAARAILTQGMGTGQVPNRDPATMIKVLAPEGEQAGLFKELKSAQDMSKGKDNLLGAFDQLNGLNTVGNRVAHLGFEPAKVNAIRDPLLAQLVEDSEGRITPQDTEMIKSLFPSPGDAPDTLSVKRNQLNKFIGEKMNFPSLQYYGFNPNAGRYTSTGEKKIKLGAPVVNGK